MTILIPVVAAVVVVLDLHVVLVVPECQGGELAGRVGAVGAGGTGGLGTGSGGGGTWVQDVADHMYNLTPTHVLIRLKNASRLPGRDRLEIYWAHARIDVHAIAGSPSGTKIPLNTQGSQQGVCCIPAC